MMEELLGIGPLAYFILVVMILGGAAFLMGQAIASTWRPYLQVIGYGLLLAFGARFLVFALLEGKLLLLTGFVADALVMIAFGSLAYRMTQVRKMISQYPWLYERRGLFGYAERGS